MEQILTFDQLPIAVNQLYIKLESIEKLLSKSNEPQPIEQPDQLLTIQQAAEFLSLAVPTLYSMVSRGDLPVMKRSKRLYFSRIELINYLKQGRRKTHAEIEAEAESYCNSKRKQP